LIGSVGRDGSGQALRDGLLQRGICTEHITLVDGLATGSALITVTPDGENSIIVASGANDAFGPQHLDAAAGVLKGAGVIVVQMEIPEATVERLAVLAKTMSVPLVVNLAPFRHLTEAILSTTDVLVVNELEAAAMLGRPIEDIDAAKAAGVELLKRGPAKAVITLGPLGAVAITGENAFHVPAEEVCVVDTTGAGDAFVGALAAAMAQGYTFDRCVVFAVRVASAAAGVPGAQISSSLVEAIEMAPADQTSF